MVTPLLIVTGPITLPFSVDAIVSLAAIVLVFILIGVSPLAIVGDNFAAVTELSTGTVAVPTSPNDTI